MAMNDRTTELAPAERPDIGGLAPRSRLRKARLVRGAILSLVLIAAFLGLEWVSSFHQHRGLPVTPWNPGLGVAFAVMVLEGPIYGLALVVAAILAEIFVLRTPLGLPAVVALAALTSASYAGAAALARSGFELNVEIVRVHDVLVLLSTGFAGALAASMLVTGLLLGNGEINVVDLSSASLPLFVGDLIGIAVVTPLVLRLAIRRRAFTLDSLVPLVPEAALYLVLGALALTMALTEDNAASFAFMSLLFLPVVAAAIRYGIDGASIALAAAQLGLVALMHLHGYDAASFTSSQVVMIVLTTTGLLVGVVVSERQEAGRAARHAERQRQAMQVEAARVARLNMVSGMASTLAHEINQPLTAARALARSAQELTRGPTPDTVRAGDNLVALVAQIDHAAAVVRRVREFLRRSEPDPSLVDIASLMREALTLAQPEAVSKGVKIELSVDDTLPPLRGDPVQLQQVMLNLVRNAIESIAESGTVNGLIRVHAGRSQNGNAIEVAVADNGPGVPQDLPLFEPLVSSRPEGLGLGLSICASIVEAHGGRIWLQSGAPGATEFRFSAPLPRDPHR
jgi:two-component system sensor kinase FixL